MTKRFDIIRQLIEEGALSPYECKLLIRLLEDRVPLAKMGVK